ALALGRGRGRQPVGFLALERAALVCERLLQRVRRRAHLRDQRHDGSAVFGGHVQPSSSSVRSRAAAILSASIWYSPFRMADLTASTRARSISGSDEKDFSSRSSSRPPGVSSIFSPSGAWGFPGSRARAVAPALLV